MFVIYKYELRIDDLIKINMPKDAEILTVQKDQKTNKPCIWALVNTENEEETRYFEIFGTGSEIKYGMGVDRIYIGTFQSEKGAFIGHVFEYLDI